MKTTNELHDIIQKLRDALIEVQCMAAVYKNLAKATPDSVNKRLAETETKIIEVLENNKNW
jgi:hypothetical protein